MLTNTKELHKNCLYSLIHNIIRITLVGYHADTMDESINQSLVLTVFLLYLEQFIFWDKRYLQSVQYIRQCVPLQMHSLTDISSLTYFPWQISMYIFV